MKRPLFNVFSRHIRRGFTLIELLVTTGIIVSLMTLTLPAISSLGKSSKLNEGGNRLAQLITFAQQNARSRNALTALIVVTDNSIDSSNRLLTLMELPPHEDSSLPQPSEWKQIAKWETLSRGVIIDYWNVSAQAVSPVFPSLTYCGKPISSDGFKYLVFLPDGSTLGDTTASVRLVEGSVSKGGAAPANYYKLTVLNTTGRIKIDRP